MPLSVIPQGNLPAEFSQRYQAVSGLSTTDFIETLFGDEALFGPVAAVSSFGAESAVLLHLIASVAPDAPVLFIDTGFHFSETLRYRDQLVSQFGLSSVKGQFDSILCQKSAQIPPVSSTLSTPTRVAHSERCRCCNVRSHLFRGG